jgi:nucleoside-diphosphate-sugar epimerase
VLTVAVTGVSGLVGRRLVGLLEADDDVGRIIGIDVVDPGGAGGAGRAGGKLDFHRADVVADDLKPLLEGVTTLVHLAAAEGPGVDDDVAARVTVDGTRRVLDAAGGAGVGHVVLASSAMVYGAWPDNPVPLTEDAALRPNPEFACAVHRAEAERLLGEWVDAHPGTAATVLRPAVVLAEDNGGWLARALVAASGMRAGEEPPAQFVHADDVASAIALAVRARLDGAYNVAPEGWIAGDQVRALAGPRPRVRLPERVAARLAGWSWRMRLGPIPPGLLPYTAHPWVVASDRLRAAGWQPANTNEEAFVAGHRPSPWADLSPQRRQELALGGLAVGVGCVVAGAVALARRRARRR